MVLLVMETLLVLIHNILNLVVGYWWYTTWTYYTTIFRKNITSINNNWFICCNYSLNSVIIQLHHHVNLQELYQMIIQNVNQLHSGQSQQGGGVGAVGGGSIVTGPIDDQLNVSQSVRTDKPM